jgi:hypothetical protein
MKFKIKSNEQCKHSEMVNSLTWSVSNEVYRLILYLTNLLIYPFCEYALKLLLFNKLCLNLIK